MTDLEIRAAHRLGACSFLPGCWEKRFARDLAARALDDPGCRLTSKQRVWLWRLVWMFRRQIRKADPEVVEIARQEGVYDPPPLLRDAW